MVTARPALQAGEAAQPRAADAALRHLHRQVKDPELRRKLTPDYDFGCKRPTFSNDYFPTFTKPHVHLETDGIDQFDPDGIVTVDGTQDRDRHARAGHRLQHLGHQLPGDRDRSAARAATSGSGGARTGSRPTRASPYRGSRTTSTLASPYSYSGLSYFTTIESQMRHIGRLFGELRRRGASTFEVTEQANEEFLDRVTNKLGDSVFYRGRCQTARSYYFNQHGEAAILRPTSTLNALREAGSFPVDDYAYA